MATKLYEIKMRDDSMCGIGVRDGDLIKIDSNAKIKSGDVAVVLIRRTQAALRRVHFVDENLIELHAIGSGKPRIQQYKSVDVETQGKFVGVCR